MARAPGVLATGHRCEWQGRGKSLFFTVPAFHLLLGLGVREPGGVKLVAAAEGREGRGCHGARLCTWAGTGCRIRSLPLPP